MIGTTIIFLYSLIYISNIHSQMTDEERKLLYEKYVKKISIRQMLVHVDTIKPPFIKIPLIYFGVHEIIKKYKFPETYNFFKDEKISPKVKSQGACGSCWAFASTTALSYRYQKLGINVDLSPQYLISCFKKNCEGEYLINTQFYLVKNGTVTESCMPYSSGGEVVENCITKCKNVDEKLKLYHSKNTYTTYNDYYNKTNYYDIVTIIIDQLVNFGPVVSSIEIYDDFISLYGNSCSERIYRHNKKNTDSDDKGSHAVVIVGYGFDNFKYYWIIQNSWGKSFCDGGLAKIEFGQIGIERITFSEPYIDNGSKAKSVNINLNLQTDCKFKFKITSNEKPEDFFEMNFINVDFPNNTFYYQCGFPSLKTKNEGICYIHLNYSNNIGGYYKLKNYNSLNKNNAFNLNFENLLNNTFFYNKNDFKIFATYYSHLYISGEKSFIILRTYHFSQDKRLISNIYSNIEISNHCSL